jgi:hypothetical protein
MNETIWVAIIGGLLTAIPSVIATIVSNNKAQAVLIAKVEANNQMVKYQIDELKKQVEKHNGVVERTYHLEEQVHVLQEKMDMYHKN